MAKKTISFNIDEADLLRLDEYAQNLERDRTYVLNQAVKMYIADAEREKVESDEADRGPYVSTEELLQQLHADRERREAERAAKTRKAS